MKNQTPMHSAVFKKLKRINKSLVDYMALLNAIGTDSFTHMDIDILAVLTSPEDPCGSNFVGLRKLLVELNRLLSPGFYAFASFRQQMFFASELAAAAVKTIPYHLLIYPSGRMLVEWEIPSRIRSMLRTSLLIRKRGTWCIPRVRTHTGQYSPFPFLQMLYEAYVLHKCSGVSTRGIRWTVLKQAEFATKNLALEVLLEIKGFHRSFNTSWDYLLEHLSVLDDYGISPRVVEQALKIRMEGYDSVTLDTLEPYFEACFSFYDDAHRKAFGGGDARAQHESPDEN